MSVSNILTKAIGVTGLGLVLYDSHCVGSAVSSVNQKNSKSDSLKDSYTDSMMLDSPSAVKSGVKRRYFNFLVDENLSPFFTGASGYVKGFTNMLVNNVVPFGLALGALIFKGADKAKGTSGILSKTFGIGLAVYGLKYLLYDVIGLFKPKHVG